MQKRPLGNTGASLSVVGFGGLMLKGARPEDAREWVSYAVEKGINYFDIGPSYGDSEALLGPALEPYREKVFLACKTLDRTRDGARRELEASLKSLRTDRFDLYQLHGISKMEEVDIALGPGGAMETFTAAREEGLVRFLGFSAHSEDAAVALMDRFAFDSVLFPVNWTCWFRTGFGRRVIEKAQEEGVGILALKALASHRIAKDAARPCRNCWYAPVETLEDARLALRFTLSKPVTAAVCPADPGKMRFMCEAASDLAPLPPEEEERLKQRSLALDAIFPQ